jgi:predicted MFS family arabinose efflux permease
MGVAAVVGGLYAGMISKRTSALKGMMITFLLWTIFTAPLAFTYPGWSMLIVGVFLGACGGALQVFYWEVLEAVRPKGMAVAALGWLWTVEGTFMALGAAVGGVVASEFSPRATLAITSVSIAIGCLIIVIGRSALKAADRIPTPEEDLLAMEHVEQTPPINS